MRFQFFLVLVLFLIMSAVVLGLIKKESKTLTLKNIPVGEKMVLTLADERSARKVKEVLEKEGREIESYPQSRFLSFRKKQGDEKALSGLDFVRAEKEVVYRILKTPNDTRFSEQTNLTQIKATGAWDYLVSAPTVTVAIIDTGIDGTHEDLTGQVVAGYDYVSSQAILANADSDDNGHGTNLAGVIGALGDNAKGISGVAWQVLLMPVKAFNSQGQAQASAVASAIDYAVNNGATVLNMSFGGDYSAAVADATSRAKNKGVVAFAAAGNDGNSNTLYPAGLEDVVSVGSVNGSDVRSSFSNYNSALDIMAPGENILTTKDNGGYTTVSGTSLATPHIAAAAALYLTNNPGFSRQNTIDALLNGTDKVAGMGSESRTDNYGQGRLNLEKTIKNYQAFSAQFLSQSISTLTLPPGETYNFSVSFRNNNATIWRASSPTPVRMGLDREHQDSTPFQGEGWLATARPVGLSADVGYAGTATFNFPLKTPLSQAAGSYRIYFRLLAENYTWFPQDQGGFWLEIKVPSREEEYKADFLGQSISVLTLPADLTYQFSATFRNSGVKSWSSGGSTPVRLGLDPEQQGASTLFQGSNWISASRPVGLSSGVAPNESANFSFQLKTPPSQAAGIYRVYFRLLAENYTWFKPENGGFWLEIRVPEVKSQWLSQTGNLQKLKRGQTSTLSATFKNTSEMPWLDFGSAPVRLGVDKNWSCCGAALQANNWISPTRITTATSSTIQPNQNATFTFNITVPPTMPLGLHEFHARLLQENRTWLEGDEGHTWWRVEVVE